MVTSYELFIPSFTGYIGPLTNRGRRRRGGDWGSRFARSISLEIQAGPFISLVRPIGFFAETD